MGRPEIKIDEKLIVRLARIGCTISEIASVSGVSSSTLKRRCGPLIKEGWEHQKASLRRLQWKTAKGGNATMQIWLGKQYLGQKDKQEVESDTRTEFVVKYVNKDVTELARN